MAAIIRRERQKSLMLRAWILSGLFFMALPGTLLGFSNLMAIATHHGLGALPAAWIQGHGHAQVFGWIGSFILGIGFYSQPTRGHSVRRIPLACFALWTSGVAMRWVANIYGWNWRALFPVSAGFELMAVLLFLSAASQHKMPASTQGKHAKPRMELWMVSVLLGTVGLGALVIFNFVECVRLALLGEVLAFPHALDQKYLVLLAWGFLVPVVWGFSARWLPTFLALAKPHTRLFREALILDIAGVLCGVAGWTKVATILLACSAVAIALGLHLTQRPHGPAKVQRHPSKLSDVYSVGLRMANCCRIDGHLGRIFRRARRHLGRLTPRSHGWVRSNHGVRDRAAHTASFCRHSKYLQQAAHVSQPLFVTVWMHAARLLRTASLRRHRILRVEDASHLRHAGAQWRASVCRKPCADDTLWPLRIRHREHEKTICSLRNCAARSAYLRGLRLSPSRTLLFRLNETIHRPSPARTVQ